MKRPPKVPKALEGRSGESPSSYRGDQHVQFIGRLSAV